MINSRTKNENYLGYLIVECIMVAVITFIGVGFALFFGSGKSDNRTGGHLLEYLFDHPLLFGFLCITPAIIGISFLLYFRSRNYIVGFFFDDQMSELTIKYRGILSRNVAELKIPYAEMKVQDFNERKILFNQTYKGKRVRLANNQKAFDFVTNNFIWEKQPRERVFFLEQINRIKSHFGSDKTN